MSDVVIGLMRVLAIAFILGFGSLMLIPPQDAPASQNTVVRIIVFASAGFLVGSFIGPAAARRVRRRMRDRETKAEMQRTNFCPDCGKAMIMVQAQRGFDAKTGEAVYEYAKSCPDWKYGYGYGYRFSMLSMPDQPGRCRQTKITPHEPAKHTHTEVPFQVDMDCIACIDQMVSDGVLPTEQAWKLYARAGMEVS